MGPRVSPVIDLADIYVYFTEDVSGDAHVLPVYTVTIKEIVRRMLMSSRRPFIKCIKT